ncbi:MAG: hypothetical protein ACLTDX_22640 [[Clostridium] innocuum]
MTGLLTLVLLVVAANLILYHYFPAPPRPQSDRVYDVAIVLGSPAEEDGSLVPCAENTDGCGNYIV